VTTRVLLVKPFSKNVYGYPATPPTGTGLLATILKQEGFVLQVLDMRLKGKNARTFDVELREFKPHIVGFTVSSFEFWPSVELCRVVKKYDNSILTVFGGPHPTMSPEKTLRVPEIDYVGIGEADASLAEFVAAFPDRDAMQKIRGIGYRANDGKIAVNQAPDSCSDMDALPFIDYSLFDINAYRVRGILTLPLITSRGCPYNCIYCVSHFVMGKRYRKRSAQSLVREIELNHSLFQTSHFTILDDTFNFEQQRVLDFCTILIDKKLDIQWDCVQGIRADRATAEMFSRMKQAGCRQIAMGIESGDENVLRSIHKGETLDDIRNALSAARSAGLITKGFFIVGSPGENRNTVLRSIQFFKENAVYIPRFSMITVYPGSPLEQWVRNNATLFYEPYDYVTKHSELGSCDVQFETKEFLKCERIAMFKYAERQADLWFIRNKLLDKFGVFLGTCIAVLFRIKMFRELLKLAFRLNLLNVYS
jgi:radical SAM superfamily enzyme YgiQ (UPF0313 family)